MYGGRGGRLPVARGDLEWETRLRAAHHRLSRTPMFGPEGGTHYSDAWAEAHRLFHRARLEGCGNAVLLETFDRMWTATELARRWSVHRTRTAERDVADEHQRLEQAVLARDTETAARQLAQHLALTAAALGTPATAVHRDLPQIL